MTRNASHIRQAPVNFAGQWSAENDAQIGSTTLAREMNKLGPPEDAPPRPPRSFDEQLAMVERGEARVVENWAPPRIDPDRTLGGVVGSINL